MSQDVAAGDPLHTPLDFQAEALAQVGDAVIIVDTEQRIVYLNAKAAAQYEVEPSAALGKPLGSFYQYIWLKPGDEEAAWRALGQSDSWRGENIHVLPGGKQLHVESTVSALKDRSGRPAGMLAIIRDITAQKQAEAALHELQEWRQLALEGARLGTFLVDLPRGAAQWDARCREIFGVGPDEPASQEKAFAIIHPEDRAGAEAAFAAAVDPASNGVYKVETRILWPDGSVHWIITNGRVYFADVDGVRVPRRLAGVVGDIDERKRYEARLLHANQRTLLAETAAHGFIYEWDVATGVVERSASMYQMLGYQPEELAGDLPAWRALVHPDDHPRMDAGGLAQILGEQEYAFEYRLRHRSGHYLHVWDKGIVDRDAAGQPVRLVGIAMDISARKQLEQALYETKERFRLAMDMVRLSIVELDKELRYTWVHNLHPDITVEGLIGKRIDVAFRPAGEVVPLQAIPEVLATGIGRRREFTGTFSDGPHTYDTIIEPQYAASGEVVGLTIVAMDITERKQAEEELQRLAQALQELNATLEQRVAARTAELERSNRELDRFAYIASHDLKAPLRAIEHLADWIAEDAGGTLSPTAQDHLAKLRGRARRLDGLLDALLHYSRAGRQRQPPQWLDTAAVVQGVADLLNPPPGFRVAIEGDLPAVYGEQAPFETLLRNLIGNALKHHDRPQAGTVTISAAARGDFVEFRVCDDGPGIAPQYHARIFEVFQTLRPRDEVEGSGMGLAIAKKTVESAGGAIWVESSVGRGATFCFTWPARAPAGAL